MKRVTIAKVNLIVKMINTDFLNKRFNEYENNTFLKEDMTLKTAAFDHIVKPKGIIVEQVRNLTKVRINDNKYCIYLTERKTGKIFYANYYNQGYSEVEIHLLKSKQQQTLSLTDLEYVYTGFAFTDRLTELGGAVLHGSAVAYKNNGIIFSANSGIGKSTHTNLWKECFGSEVTIVNDDKPAIRFYDEIPFIFGTPWSGKTDSNTNIQVPLKAIIFIKRAESNFIERLNARDSIFNLTSQIFRSYYDENIGLKTLDAIEKLVQTVPIYRLHCNISQEAVEVVYNQLVKEGILKI